MGEHAAAIQAIAAIVSGVITVILVVVTIIYVRANQQMVHLQRLALLSQYEPLVLPAIPKLRRQASGEQTLSVKLRNSGQAAAHDLQIRAWHKALYGQAVLASIDPGKTQEVLNLVLQPIPPNEALVDDRQLSLEIHYVSALSRSMHTRAVYAMSGGSPMPIGGPEVAGSLLIREISGESRWLQLRRGWRRTLQHCPRQARRIWNGLVHPGRSRRGRDVDDEMGGPNWL